MFCNGKVVLASTGILSCGGSTLKRFFKLVEGFKRLFLQTNALSKKEEIFFQNMQRENQVNFIQNSPAWQHSSAEFFRFDVYFKTFDVISFQQKDFPNKKFCFLNLK